MPNLMQLRETVDLPAGYSDAIPEPERKKLLLNSLVEYRLKNRFLGLKPKGGRVKRKPFAGYGRTYTRQTYNTNQARIARFLSTVKRANCREIEAGTGIKVESVSPMLVFMQNDKLVKQSGRKRFNGGRISRAYSVTPAGVAYGEKP